MCIIYKETNFLIDRQTDIDIFDQIGKNTMIRYIIMNTGQKTFTKANYITVSAKATFTDDILKNKINWKSLLK